eukprot:CAMPEP_0119092526 /NCGR_PEP_ID=MMETSP1178-20130426/160081_1 /TAXON_ID=33656 /ORGANISM="unid sp, Strain CCMP2000" /LENGTH=88 /DNA_ID=CAMNT_0007076113 /DNA_START=33 /DNA_END=295 /DNA_ORIENTATION=+
MDAAAHADLDADFRPMQRITKTSWLTLEQVHFLALAGGLAVLLLLIILGCSLRSKRPRGGSGARTSFPAFDLEGNAGGALPPPDRKSV